MPMLSRTVLHQSQRSQADCLPTAVQMVLAYLGISVTYAELYRLLGTQQYGTPFRHLERLRIYGVEVQLDYLSPQEIGGYLAQDVPVIAGVNTAELPYWQEAVDHVVVVVGLADGYATLHDPALPHGPTRVTETAFALAQLEFDCLCGVVQVH
jgi:ABC-type bacteriocin/lantibiotic exporter with double-glycine peptidase domain